MKVRRAQQSNYASSQLRQNTLFGENGHFGGLSRSLSLSCLAPRENAIPECATTVSVSVLPACGAKQQVDPPLVAHPASSRTQSPKQIVDLRPYIQFYKSLIRPCVIYRTHPLPRQSTHPPRTHTHTHMRAHVAQGIPRAPLPYTTQHT
jgi:hypothetical protein